MLPGQQLDGLLCAFNESGTLFAVATPDGRLKSFDTVTGRLRSSVLTGAKQTTPNGATPHMGNGSLATGNQCLSWLDQQASAQERSGNPAGPSHSWVAVGTASGDVRAYDTASGELQWQCRESNEGGVASLMYAARRSQSLLAAGADCQVCRLEAGTGAVKGRFKASKHPITGAALSADGTKLLLGSSTLSLWDVEGEKRICKFTGHPTSVRAVAFAPSGNYALSAAGGERSVAVWDTSASKRAKKSGVAVAGLTMDDPAVQLHTCSAGADAADEAGAFYAAAVSEAGEAYAWRCLPVGDAVVKGQLLARVRVGSQQQRAGSAAGSAEVVLAAHLEHGSAAGATLLVARGSSTKPIFERVQITLAAAEAAAAAGTAAPAITLEPAVGGALLPNGTLATAAASASKATPTSAKRAAAAAAATVLGAENAGVAMRHRVAAQDAALTPTPSKKRSEPEPEEAAATPATANGVGSVGSDEEDEAGLEDGEHTLGARVAALEEQQRQQQAQQQQQQQQQAQAMDLDAGAAGDAEAAAAPGGPIKADSLSVLLTQALRSGDRDLLERCLAISNERVVANSVRRLVPMDAAALLRAAVERLQSKPARGQQLGGWVRAVLVHHTAYLMAAPSVQPVMTSLYQTIEARLANHRAMLSLSGRLDLLLSQMPRQAAARAAATQQDEGAGAGPQVHYVESDSEVEVEDPFAAGGDEGANDEGSDGGSADEEQEEGSDMDADDDYDDE